MFLKIFVKPFAPRPNELGSFKITSNSIFQRIIPKDRLRQAVLIVGFVMSLFDRNHSSACLKAQEKK